MKDPVRARELDARIRAIRENIRELVEQAAATSGAADESLISDRIANLEAQLAAMVKEREALEGP